MKAMVLDRPAPVSERPLQLRDCPVPEAASREILVQVRACGVCHTDLHVVEGEVQPPSFPIIPGHEIVGTVKAAGREASRFRTGDRVGIAWLRHACGSCEYCRSGRENLCEQARFTGLHADGGYAEYATVHEDFAYAIPKGISDVAAAPLLCAGIIGYRALKRSGVGRGESLGVYGFGASAHIAIQVARHWGCEVFVWSRSEGHRVLARSLGASWCGAADDEPPTPMHASILFAPVGQLVPTALRHLRRGGTLCVAGIHLSPIPQMQYEPHLFYEKTLTSVTANTRQDGRELLQLAVAIPIRCETQSFPLAAANEALLAMKRGEINGAAVLAIE